MSEKKRILIWGSGKIGRGFIGDLFYRGGYHIDFVDASKELVDTLKSRGKYTALHLAGADEQEEVVIDGFSAYHTEEKKVVVDKIIHTPLMAVVVFPQFFEASARDIALGIEERAVKNSEPLDILVCANMLHPSEKFKQHLEGFLTNKGMEYFREKVGLVENLIMRMAIEPTEEMKDRDSLIVVTNGYPELPVDRSGFKGEIPHIKGICPTDNIRAEEVRKIYTYNGIHALLAYLGSAKGHKYISDCMEDKEIESAATGAINEIGQALQKEYGFSPSDMETWNRRVLKNMANPILKDTVMRVGADPVRKLARNDRLVSPALLCMKHGIQPDNLAKGIAHGFRFNNPKDQVSQDIRQFVENNSIREGVKKFCQLEEEEELINLIISHYTQSA